MFHYGGRSSSMMLIKYILILLVISSMTGVSYAAEGHDHGKAEHGSEYEGVAVEISKKTQELIGLKTEKVEASSVKEKVALMGRIVQDPEHTTDVFAAKSGTLKKCKINLGDVVQRDQLLCTVESQGELIQVKAPVDGVVMAQFVLLNEKVDTDLPVLMMADLSKLVASFDVYERDLQRIKNDQRVLIFAGAYPDEVFEGRVVFVSPRVDEGSYTVKIRVEINNERMLLKPGMFLRGEALVQDKQAHLSVPIDAVQSIEGEDVVFVQDDPESFMPVKVDMQLASNKRAFISGDLSQDALVVTEGSYMIKSKILENEISGGHCH